MQRPNTFPRETSMRESSNHLQELRTRLLARTATTKIFNKIWEEKTLPRLQDTMKNEHDGDYSITIQFDYHENQRIVEVMTEVELSTDIDEKLKSQVSLDFDDPDDIEFDVGLQCIVGEVKRSTGHSATIHDNPEDGWARPANTTSHSSLKLGDSVGVQDGDSATTLGPAIEFKGNIGFMVSCHLFDGKPEWRESQDVRHPLAYRIVHPSPIDRTIGRKSRPIARLHAHSGPMYRSTRYSRTLRKFITDNPGPMHVVTDWAVCIADSNEPKLENRLRYAPDGREFEAHSRMIPGIWKLSPQLNIVRSTGRSSGIRYGVVCETPSAVFQSGIPTREWYVENDEGILSTDLWNRGGIGMPGDSGAAIVEDVSGRLIGQVWGRNVYGGDPAVQRITYFTHIHDLFDDVRDRYPEEIGYPQLLGQTDPVLEPPAVDSETAPEIDGTTLSSSVMRSRAHSSATDRQNLEIKGSNGSFVSSSRDSSEISTPTKHNAVCSGKTMDAPQFAPGSNLGIPAR
ncbi:hypothetical protein CcaCcLH18_06790 [Colletotrichum camelliae]|nr:hypothetical protein CcaCcLH18_06790 [Colletotrichum camelliae]